MSPADRPLLILTLIASLATLWLIHPYLDAVMVAAVVTILTIPLHRRVVRLVRGRRALATAITLLILVVGIFVPALSLGLVVLRELVTLANQTAAMVQPGAWDTLVNNLARWEPVAWLVEAAGGRSALAATLDTALRDTILSTASAITQSVPNVLSVTVSVVLKGVVFLLAVTTLLHRGAELLDWVRRLSPLPPQHTERLVEVFETFARNVVFAGIVAGAVQGCVATAGYLIAGVERAVLFGVLTGVFAYVPIVGTTLVWLPVVILLAAEDRGPAAAFVFGWSIFLTGTVDNIIKPLIVRGRSDVPLLLVFLGVFGGLAAFGVIGVLVGPVMVAMLLALIKIYAEQRAGTIPPASGRVSPGGAR